MYEFRGAHPEAIAHTRCSPGRRRKPYLKADSAAPAAAAAAAGRAAAAAGGGSSPARHRRWDPSPPLPPLCLGLSVFPFAITGAANCLAFGSRSFAEGSAGGAAGAPHFLPGRGSLPSQKRLDPGVAPPPRSPRADRGCSAGGSRTTAPASGQPMGARVPCQPSPRPQNKTRRGVPLTRR